MDVEAVGWWLVGLCLPLLALVTVVDWRITRRSDRAVARPEGGRVSSVCVWLPPAELTAEDRAWVERMLVPCSYHGWQRQELRR